MLNLIWPLDGDFTIASLTITLFVAIGTILVISAFIRQKATYKSKRGIKRFKPLPYFGNIEMMSNVMMPNKWTIVYDKIYGFYILKVTFFCVSDVLLLKDILIRSFSYS